MLPTQLVGDNFPPGWHEWARKFKPRRKRNDQSTELGTASGPKADAAGMQQQVVNSIEQDGNSSRGSASNIRHAATRSERSQSPPGVGTRTRTRSELSVASAHAQRSVSGARRSRDASGLESSLDIPTKRRRNNVRAGIEMVS